MLSRQHRHTNRHQRATLRKHNGSPNDRRGTVLLIALGALGVISLAGLSYVTFVRLDRLGSTTHARVANFQQQVDATTDWIGTVLSADLYGNKIISSTTPRDNLQIESNPNNRVVATPTRMEDAEFRDHPSWDMRTFAPEPLQNFTGQGSYDKARLDLISLGSSFTPSAGSRRFEVAPQDDAWLAPIEPLWNFFGGEADLQWNSVWSSITNLRSAYVYVDNADNPENPTPLDLTDDAYLRLDGRFADLGQFFLDPIDLGGVVRANPGAFISVVEPGRESGQALDVNQSRFAPMNTLDTHNDPQNANFDFQRIDERFWVDTDGDLRADARWQELDALGSLFGYRWVVGARVIDMSGLVNINTATTTNYGADTAALSGQQDRLPTGRTPADVDFFRVLGTTAADQPGLNWYGARRYDFTINQPDGNLAKSVFVDQLANQAFSNHLAEGIGLYEVAIEQLNGVNASNVVIFNPSNGVTGAIPQSYRDAHYLNAGANPDSPTSPGARSYPVSEMIDLVSFWGTSRRSLISRLEERIDGPVGASGYLPSPNDPNQMVFGPLVSARQDADARRFPSTMNPVPLPTSREIRYGTRNQMTTESGTAKFSPIPYLNLDATDPDGRNVYLGKDEHNRIDLASGETRDIFEACVWSLMPLAVNEVLTGELIRPSRTLFDRNGANILNGARLASGASGTPGDPTDPAALNDAFLNPTFHYGGGLGGEAERMLSDGSGLVAGGFDNAGLSLVPGTEANITAASYALLTSLKLSANITDAFDTDSRPTVVRFFATQSGATAAEDPALNFVGDSESELTNGQVGVGTRFRFGEIPSKLLDERVVGRKILDADAENLYYDDQTSAGGTIEFLNGGLNGMLQPELFDPTRGAGLTVIGLEQQPFLSEAFSMAVYTNAGSVDTAGGNDGAPNLIVPASADDQVGSIIAFQLVNPWPDAIPATVINDLEIWILNPASAGDRIDDPAARPLKLSPRGVQIPAGGAATFAYVIDAADGTLFTDATDGFTNRILENGWFDLDIVNPADDPGLGNTDPVFFDEWAGAGPGDAGPRILLMRTISTLEAPAVIDTLSGDRGTEFPRALNGPTTLLEEFGSTSPSGTASTVFPGSALPVLTGTTNSVGYDPAAIRLLLITNPNPTVRGRLAVSGSLSKPIATPAGSGLSTAVLDFGPASTMEVANDPTAPTGASGPMAFVWLEELLPPGVMTNGFKTEFSTLSTVIKGEQFNAALNSINIANRTFADDDFMAAVPAWEVLIPNQAPFSKADIALVSKHAHFCINHRLDRVDSWVTAGQQLAAEARSSGFRTQTLGLLDLTSSLPGLAGNGASGFYPNPSPEGVIPDESLALPLALRIFEPFEALNPNASGDRFNGRININTATQRVLESLPWVAPWANYANNLAIPATGVRARAIMAYRDAVDPDLGSDVLSIVSDAISVVTPEILTNLTKALIPSDPGTSANDFSLRRRDRTQFANGRGQGGGFSNLGRGFAATGELAILDSWTASDPTQNFAAQPNPSFGDYFGTPDALPGFVRELGLDPASSALSSGAFAIDDRDGYTVPENGQAERIALYRALANIVETRSDVYGAWFVLRAYDPNVIESITLNPGDTLAQQMEAEEFAPAYQSRWFVLYDRSNVDSPGELPRVLLQVQLPSANP